MVWVKIYQIDASLTNSITFCHLFRKKKSCYQMFRQHLRYGAGIQASWQHFPAPRGAGWTGRHYLPVAAAFACPRCSACARNTPVGILFLTATSAQTEVNRKFQNIFIKQESFSTFVHHMTHMNRLKGWMELNDTKYCFTNATNVGQCYQMKYICI